MISSGGSFQARRGEACLYEVLQEVHEELQGGEQPRVGLEVRIVL